MVKGVSRSFNLAQQVTLDQVPGFTAHRSSRVALVAIHTQATAAATALRWAEPIQEKPVGPGTFVPSPSCEAASRVTSVRNLPGDEPPKV